MKPTFYKPRLLTVFLVLSAIFFYFFIVTTEFTSTVKSWTHVNISSISHPTHHNEYRSDKKDTVQSKDAVTLPKVSDQPYGSPSNPREYNGKQEQVVLGVGAPKGKPMTPETGWSLLQHRAYKVQQVCRRFKVQHALASRDNGLRGTAVSGNHISNTQTLSHTIITTNKQKHTTSHKYNC